MLLLRKPIFRKLQSWSWKLIDYKFPHRHRLIIGNSLDTIPQFHKDNPNFKFDLLFIDGGHEYDVAIGDLINCKNVAHKNSLVILDDTTYIERGQKVTSWTEGPTLAFKKMLSDGEIKQTNIHVYNKITGMSVGKYVGLTSRWLVARFQPIMLFLKI